MATGIVMMLVPIVFTARVLMLCHRHRVNAAKVQLQEAIKNRDVA